MSGRPGATGLLPVVELFQVECPYVIPVFAYRRTKTFGHL